AAGRSALGPGHQDRGDRHRPPAGGARGHHHPDRRPPHLDRGARGPRGAAGRRPRGRRRHPRRADGELGPLPLGDREPGGGAAPRPGHRDPHRGARAPRDPGGGPMSTTAQSAPGDPEQQTYSAEDDRLSRQRSFALLGELISPVKGQFVVMAIMVVIAQLAVVAGPAIIAWGIDHGLPSLLAGDSGPAFQAAALAVGAAVVGGVLTYGYVGQSVVVGQRMLLALRRKVFRFTQQQDLEFHESYTSGRIVSRQTSDMEALRELLDSGVNVMVGASLSMVFTIVLIVTMDPVTGLVMLL